MVLLIDGEALDKSKTSAAVRATFMKRATHDVPKELDSLPAEWEPVFDALAKECDLAMELREGLNWYANSRKRWRRKTVGTPRQPTIERRQRRMKRGSTNSSVRLAFPEALNGCWDKLARHKAVTELSGLRILVHANSFFHNM
jgi:hypothetical protein